MKNVLLCFILLMVATTLKAQSGLGGINYQAVARNANGTTLSNQHLSIRFSIPGGSSSGNVQYQETQEVTTNQLGLFTAQVQGIETSLQLIKQGKEKTVILNR